MQGAGARPGLPGLPSSTLHFLANPFPVYNLVVACIQSLARATPRHATLPRHAEIAPGETQLKRPVGLTRESCLSVLASCPRRVHELSVEPRDGRGCDSSSSSTYVRTYIHTWHGWPSFVGKFRDLTLCLCIGKVLAKAYRGLILPRKHTTDTLSCNSYGARTAWSSAYFGLSW